MLFGSASLVNFSAPYAVIAYSPVFADLSGSHPLAYDKATPYPSISKPVLPLSNPNAMAKPAATGRRGGRVAVCTKVVKGSGLRAGWCRDCHVYRFEAFWNAMAYLYLSMYLYIYTYTIVDVIYGHMCLSLLIAIDYHCQFKRLASSDVCLSNVMVA